MASAATTEPVSRPESSWWSEELGRLDTDLPTLPPTARAALRRTVDAIVCEIGLPPAVAGCARALLARLDEVGVQVEPAGSRSSRPARFSARVHAAVPHTHPRLRDRARRAAASIHQAT